MFPTLSQAYCTQIDRRGKSHRVRLLPVRLLETYFRILANVSAKPGAEAFAEARRELRAIAEQVLPPEMAGDLLTLDFSNTNMLVQELFFGENENANRQEPSRRPQKNGNRPESEYDYEFAAARMLSVYPGYTLDKLLDLSAPVFFRLLELSGRVQADQALNQVFPAVMAGVNGGEAYSALTMAHGGYFIHGTATYNYTDEQLQAAYERMKKPRKTIRKFAVGMTAE